MEETLGSAACAPPEQGWGRRACPSPSRNCPGAGMCNSLPPQPCHAVFHLARNVFAIHQPTPVLGAARPCMAGHVPAPGILSHPHNTEPSAKKIPPCRAFVGMLKLVLSHPNTGVPRGGSALLSLCWVVPELGLPKTGAGGCSGLTGLLCPHFSWL